MEKITKENQITDLLKKQLENKYKKILVRKYPSNTRKIKDALKEPVKPIY